MNSIKPYSDDSGTGNWITGRNLVPMPLCFYHSVNAVKVKVEQPRYKPGVAQRVPGS